MTNSEHSQSNPSSNGATQMVGAKSLDQKSVKEAYPQKAGESVSKYASRIMSFMVRGKSIPPYSVIQAQGQPITTSGGFIVIQGGMYIRANKKTGGSLVLSYEKAGQAGSVYILSPETKVTPLELYSGGDGAWVIKYTPEEVEAYLSEKKAEDWMTQEEIDECRINDAFSRRVIENAESTVNSLCQMIGEKTNSMSIKAMLYILLRNEKAEKSGKIVFINEFGALINRFNIPLLGGNLISPESYGMAIFRHCAAHPELEKEFMNHIMETFYKFNEVVSGSNGYTKKMKLTDLDKAITKLVAILAS